jgi:hypothetical protein
MKTQKEKIMNKLSVLTASCFVLAASAISSHAQSAIATISEVTGTGGNFDYTITLKNTGTLDLNSFWYGWTTSGNNLPSNPTSPGNSLGWANVLDFNSIQWQNTTSASALAPGQSATFTFDSTSTISAITTAPSGESVAYTSDSIQFNQGLAGQSTSVFSPTIASVPEPSALSMLAMGSAILAVSFRRRCASPRPASRSAN